MSKLIPPTPGRVVWYWPSQQEIDAKAFVYDDPTQPLAATVARVWHDRMVNLSVVDHAGAQFRRTSVKLLQEDDERPHTSEGPFAEWMPYQKHQKELESWGVLVGLDGHETGETGETKGYTDGTTATGTAPVPEQSPDEPERKWVKVGDGWSRTTEVRPDMVIGAGDMVCVDIPLGKGECIRLWTNTAEPDVGWQQINPDEYAALVGTDYAVEPEVFKVPTTPDEKVAVFLSDRGLTRDAFPQRVLDTLTAMYSDEKPSEGELLEAREAVNSAMANAAAASPPAQQEAAAPAPARKTAKSKA